MSISANSSLIATTYDAVTLHSQPTKYVAASSGVTHQQENSEQTTRQTGTDRISLSQEGIQRSRENGTAAPEQAQKTDSQNNRLSSEEQKAVFELKKRDLEVKSHEQAHLAGAGQYAAGGPRYTYQTGPDGRRYAVGGEVPIDTGKERTPEQTIQKMRTVKAAALAPANPSNADRQIAATASRREAEARQELQAEKTSPDTQDDSLKRQDEAQAGQSIENQSKTENETKSTSRFAQAA